MKKQHQQLLITALALGLGYYFLIHLPEEEAKQQAVKKQSQQTASQKSPEILKAEAEADAWQKGRIWELPKHSWADTIVKAKSSSLIGEYQKYASLFPDGDNRDGFGFSRSAPYTIYFPPSMREYYEKGKELDLDCGFLEKEDELILSEDIEEWIKRVEPNPIRGEIDANKRDNSAIFYGSPGTGKTATMTNICVRADKYPLVVLKGSNLTPTESDQSAEILPLQKFAYTISELEWSLVKDYGLEREDNGEVCYILFVDEANQISNNSLIFQSNGLKFLKDCLEGVDKDERSNNLWVFATNHLDQIEEAVYREGRLSNPLDFSWNWETFLKHAKKFNIFDELPERWKEKAYLKPDENELVAKFNIKSFQKDFLGDDKQRPNRPKFWSLFIEKNPDACYIPEDKENEQEADADDSDNEEESKEISIEVGEFLEFFWYIKKKNMSNYNGSFESVQKPTTEKILEAGLNNIAKVINVKLDEIIEKLEPDDDDGEGNVIVKLQVDVETLKNAVSELRNK